MNIETDTEEFGRSLNDFLLQVQYQHDSVVIKEKGTSIAALVNAKVFQQICRMQDRFDTLSRRIETGFSAVSERQGTAEIELVVSQVRNKGNEPVR